MLAVPETSIVRATWKALLHPRRLLPILVVCTPLVVAQARWSLDPFGLPIGVLMCLSFIFIAPVSYRVLFPDGLDLSHGAVRLVLYVLVGCGVILSVGAGIPKVLGVGYTFLTERTSLLVITAMFLVGGWGLGRDIGYEKRVQRLQLEAERAQLLALKAHLDPHFLFNTLNAIAEWCRIDGEVAEAAVLRLSGMLRAVLEGVKAPTWSLSRELEVVDELFELHLLRDKSLFTMRRSLPSPLPNVQVPPMALVSLAENAVKHGPGAGHRGELALSVTEERDDVVITLENPGPYKGPRAGSEGLPTLRRQLELTWGRRASLVVESAGSDRTRAELRLPRSPS
ncbi:MAG: sensor histidine kinase [Archangium gephyra]|uniref:Sensor histidine kinase n=1 Tax=Archangium gephyra TaxID=48 RepID=A0A2W5V1S4_9BACT|nr:MAG: sensor histidine kinase [Archangium gephyra]